MKIQSDIERVNWILFLSMCPLIISLFWVCLHIRVESMPFAPIISLVMSMIFIMVIAAYSPRVQHWREAIRKFEEEYVYEAVVEG